MLKKQKSGSADQHNVEISTKPIIDPADRRASFGSQFLLDAIKDKEQFLGSDKPKRTFLKGNTVQESKKVVKPIPHKVPKSFQLDKRRESASKPVGTQLETVKEGQRDSN